MKNPFETQLISIWLIAWWAVQKGESGRLWWLNSPLAVLMLLESVGK